MQPKTFTLHGFHVQNDEDILRHVLSLGRELVLLVTCLTHPLF